MTDAQEAPERKPHRWQKGESGNPKGRPKSDNPIMDEARKLAPRAIMVAQQIMDGEAVIPQARLAAVAIILERAYGRPKQELDITHRRPEEMTDEQVYARLYEIRTQRALLTAGRGDPLGDAGQEVSGSEELQ